MLNEMVVVGVDVFDGEKIVKGQEIKILGDDIVQVASKVSAKANATYIDGRGSLAVAGFIDLQLNGCGGVMFNADMSKNTLAVMNQTNLKSGTTQFLPTLISCSEADVKKAVELINQFTDKESIGVLGLHLEGGFINVEKKGAHQAKYIRVLDDENADFLVKNNLSIKLITLAAELVEQHILDKIAKANIKISLGHTNGTYDELSSKSGIQVATHLFNAMSPFTGREAGAVGYIFDKKPYSGIILDGIHVDYASVRLAKQILGEKLFIVTDAVMPAGTDMTSFDMVGLAAYVTEGRCHYENGTLAGAAITMIESLNNVLKNTDISLEECLRMMTLYPARAIGVDDRYGKITPGHKANIALLNHRAGQYSVEATIQMGRLVYEA